MKNFSDLPWSKASQLVVALDIGTVYSSVTYSYLRQNHKPYNTRVTHWPSRVGIGGSSDAKTPSMLYYDRKNKVKATGAAADTPAMRHEAGRNGWNLVRYFKLHMHPPEMVQAQGFTSLERLPKGLSVEQVYADMISYMLNHTRGFFNQQNSAVQWEQLTQTMTLVIAHPNGWGTRGQARLRKAVVLSRVMSELDAQCCVRFVPEAEAAVHYVLWEKLQELQPEEEFIVCDAGGSTVDTTAYRVLQESDTTPETNNISSKKGSVMSRLFRVQSSARRQNKPVVPTETPAARPPIHLEELKASGCQPAGGALVNETFVAWLKEQFFALPPEHAYNLEQCVQKAEENFEANCKREFRMSLDAPSVYIVDMSTRIPELRYHDGNIILWPHIVKGFFEKSVRLIVESIHEQVAGTRVKYIFLVGGFGASQYLKNCVVNAFQSSTCRVMILEDSNGKAVSDGSTIWFVRQGVVGRAARMSFGLPVHTRYDPSIASHRRRPKELKPDGRYHVKNKWDLVVEKDKIVGEQSEICRSYAWFYSTSHPELESFKVNLYAWTGDLLEAPEWVKDSTGNVINGFSIICEINADLSGMQGLLKQREGDRGTYYELKCDLCLEFGGVELKAYLKWDEKGMKRRSDATIVIVDNPLPIPRNIVS